MGSIEDYEESWMRSKEADESRNKLIENLLDEIRKLSKTYKDTSQQLDRVQETSNMFFERYRQAEDRYREADEVNKSHQRAMDRNTFILVLIDGDCMNFLDDQIKNGEIGGQEAAQRLRTSVLDYLRHDILEPQDDVKIIIHVYGNLTGLSKAYNDAGILEQRDVLSRFVRGFNMAHPLCNFIDAGNGKECSDDKIREDFKLHVSLPQYRHIIFGGSADNGYARMLLPYVSDDAINKRITLLEGPPFAMELSKLAHKFKTSAFSKVFRSTKIAPRTVSFSNPAPTPVPVRESPSLSTWASAVTKAVPLERIPTPEVVNKEAEPDDWIPQNSEGYRIDLPLKKHYPALVGNLKSRKLCNVHHLLNDCPYENCKHTHGKLNEKEVSTLRFIARTSPCRWGAWCDDPDCFSGHQCPHIDCYGGPECRFSSEMHHVDMKIVNRP